MGKTLTLAEFNDLQGRFSDSWSKGYAIVDAINCLDPDTEVNVENLKWLTIVLKDCLDSAGVAANELFAFIPKQCKEIQS